MVHQPRSTADYPNGQVELTDLGAYGLRPLLPSSSLSRMKASLRVTVAV
jgi:hypothetical protein